MSIEVIEMIAHIAVAIAVIFSGVALFISSQTNKLQRESLQANMFNDITKRINELYDKIPPKSNKSGSLIWNINLLNAFEHFAFFVNNGYLKSDMTLYYKTHIINYCDTLKGECPAAIKHINKTQHPRLYHELKKYYKCFTSKSIPF